MSAMLAESRRNDPNARRRSRQGLLFENFACGSDEELWVSGSNRAQDDDVEVQNVDEDGTESAQCARAALNGATRRGISGFGEPAGLRGIEVGSKAPLDQELGRFAALESF